MKTLRFVNTYDELDQPMVHEFRLSRDSDHRPIMAWYGAFCAGDPYKVYLDGFELVLDKNGEQKTPQIGGGPECVFFDQTSIDPRP